MSESLPRSVADGDPLSLLLSGTTASAQDEEALFNPFAASAKKEAANLNDTPKTELSKPPVQPQLTQKAETNTSVETPVSNEVNLGSKLKVNKDPNLSYLSSLSSTLAYDPPVGERNIEEKPRNISKVDNSIETGQSNFSSASSDVTSTPKKKTEEGINFELETGETLQLRLDGVTFMSAFRDKMLGVLVLTNYRLSFCPERNNESKNATNSESLHWLHTPVSLFHVPVGCIWKISRANVGQVARSKESVTYLSVTCKDLRVLLFKMESPYHLSKVLDLARTIVFPVTVEAFMAGKNGGNSNNDETKGVEWLFAFSHKKKRRANGSCTDLIDSNGWDVLDQHKEWARLGITESNYWRVSDINQDYQFCPTYPKEFVVPANISDEQLLRVGKFRSRARIPVMCWLHKNGGSIWRCSQPKVGMGSKVCLDDEFLIASIRSCTPCNHVKIVDARPFKNALGNIVKGMGYEDESRYKGTSISFQNIENIHIVRSSLEKLFKITQSTSNASSGSNWLSTVENTGWLNHIRSILVAAIKVAGFVGRKGLGVVIHCSDGWDRTAQLTSLAQVLLDPLYRTIRGFQIIIEKEWVSLGYNFQRRTGHGVDGSKDTGADQRSPIFLQFIDCIWQLQRLFPCEFEFNERFLLCILENLYSCRFGTFLYDSERDRLKNRVKELTVSLWEYVNMEENLERFTNPFYKCMEYVDRDTNVEQSAENDKAMSRHLLPRASVIARQVVLWQDYYMRFCVHPTTLDHAFVNTESALSLNFERAGCGDINGNKEQMKKCMDYALARIAALETQMLQYRSTITSLTLDIDPEKPRKDEAKHLSQEAS